MTFLIDWTLWDLLFIATSFELVKFVISLKP